MGAINKLTNNYEYPIIASKENKYKCPDIDCGKDVIFRKGIINQPHFAHYKSDKSNVSCNYYEKPSEDQIHKDAKLLMKTLLDAKTPMIFQRRCNNQNKRYKCRNIKNIHILHTDYNENTKAIIEYRFDYNNSDNRRADVALIEYNQIKYIFEIYNTSATKEQNRPEPWLEINALNLINYVNSGILDNRNIIIPCLRKNYKCDKCIKYDVKRSMKKIEQARKDMEHDKQDKEKTDIERMEREKLDNEKKELYRIEQKRLNKEKRKMEQIEKELIEKTKIEIETKRIEALINDEKLKEDRSECKCGLKLINICSCDNPIYELMKISNNMCCNHCRKWKCRCG
jgi:hypothetical protein